VEKEERENCKQCKQIKKCGARNEQVTGKDEALEGSRICKPQPSRKKMLLGGTQNRLNGVCCQSKSVDWQ